MTVILRDAMVFLKNSDAEPIIGAISLEPPLRANAPLAIKTNGYTLIVLTKQVKTLIFKLNNKEFGFIADNTFFTSDDYYWNTFTNDNAGRELHECFPDLLERTNNNGSNFKGCNDFFKPQY